MRLFIQYSVKEKFCEVSATSVYVDDSQSEKKLRTWENVK